MRGRPEAVAKSKFEEPGNRRRGRRQRSNEVGKEAPKGDQGQEGHLMGEDTAGSGSWRVSRKHLEGRGPEAE